VCVCGVGVGDVLLTWWCVVLFTLSYFMHFNHQTQHNLNMLIGWLKFRLVVKLASLVARDIVLAPIRLGWGHL